MNFHQIEIDKWERYERQVNALTDIAGKADLDR